METQRTHSGALQKSPLLTLDGFLFLIFIAISLELNVPYSLDQLDFHNSMQAMPWLQSLLIPGGMPHPLAIMGHRFVPLKLVIRTLSVFAAFLYLGVDFLRLKTTFKSILFYFVILLNVVIPMLLLIGATVIGKNPALAHDGGVIQIEEAMKFVLNGENPYVRDYTGTRLENWRGFKNNIVYHLPYMPGAFLFPLPFYLVWNSFFGWYDQRILYLLFFLGAVFLIQYSIKPVTRRMTVLFCFALNPFIIRFLLLGTNDIFPLFLLTASAVFFLNRRNGMGFLFLAAACAVKQFAWFFVPFFIIFAFRIESMASLKAYFRKHWKAVLPGLVLFFLTVFPYVIQAPGAFYEDTVQYGSGGLPTSYPMQGLHGYGFATLLLFFRWVPNGNVNFPFFLFQISVCFPLLIVLIKNQVRNNSLENAILFSAVLLFAFMFFSRYLHGNFLGFLMFWPAYAWGLHQDAGADC